MLTDLEDATHQDSRNLISPDPSPNTVPQSNIMKPVSLSSRIFKIEWLGQTIASLSWIISIPVYGNYEAGDWLQLLAASAWFIANIASLFSEDGC